MKKLFLSLVAVIMAATASYAQNTLVATLSHGEDITMFYGTYALQNAMNAAQSGDVINLSGGTFQATNITKAVTLRGTGINAAIPTNVLNSLTINIPSTDPNRFSMEGIRCSGGIQLNGNFENPYFLKCWFTTVYGSGDFKNALFVNCRITDYNESAFYGSSTTQFVNCYVTSIKHRNSAASASFINCVIRPYEGWDPRLLSSCQFVNCIFYNNSSSSATSLPSTSIATNCIAINDNNLMSNLFNNSQPNPNCGFALYSEVFKNFTGALTWGQTFELTDEAKTTYLGNDGTEVGMYGGVMPYTDVPPYPQIKKMNVANKATADGKLSVEIEVSAAE